MMQRVWSKTTPIVVGLVLSVLGIGNIWRGGAASVVGAVFLAVGLIVTGASVQRLRAAAGADSPPLGLQLLMLAAPVAVGAAIYVGLLYVFNRS